MYKKEQAEPIPVCWNLIAFGKGQCQVLYFFLYVRCNRKNPITNTNRAKQSMTNPIPMHNSITVPPLNSIFSSICDILLMNTIKNQDVMEGCSNDFVIIQYNRLYVNRKRIFVCERKAKS